MLYLFKETMILNLALFIKKEKEDLEKTKIKIF